MTATSREIQQWVQDALLAVEHARSVREVHRRSTRRGNKQREQDIDLAMTRIKKAMAPIRSIIAKFPYLSEAQVSEPSREALQSASAHLQAERRKLWKMAHPKTRQRRKRRRA